MIANKHGASTTPGQRMRLLRKKAGLTLGDAASNCGVSVRTLSRVERDLVEASRGLVWGLAELYDVPVGAIDASQPEAHSHNIHLEFRQFTATEAEYTFPRFRITGWIQGGSRQTVNLDRRQATELSDRLRSWLRKLRESE